MDKERKKKIKEIIKQLEHFKKTGSRAYDYWLQKYREHYPDFYLELTEELKKRQVSRIKLVAPKMFLWTAVGVTTFALLVIIGAALIVLLIPSSTIVAP